MTERLVFTAELNVYGVCVAEIDGIAEISMDRFGNPDIDRIDLDGIGDQQMTVTNLPSDHPLYPLVVDWLRMYRADEMYRLAREDREGRRQADRQLMRAAE